MIKGIKFVDKSTLVCYNEPNDVFLRNTKMKKIFSIVFEYYFYYFYFSFTGVKALCAARINEKSFA